MTLSSPGENAIGRNFAATVGENETTVTGTICVAFGVNEIQDGINSLQHGESKRTDGNSPKISIHCSIESHERIDIYPKALS